ncbi:MAG: hypothetical protein CMC43_05450 [Flavobacteriaceae bacterium]|nr:hypothetical protein [Flavobacteriaceae bacterium]
MFRFLFTILFAVSLVHSQSQQSWVDSLYTQMTLDQKIGQLFMVMAYPDGNNSKKIATSHQIQKQHIGGGLFSKGTIKQQLIDTRDYQNQSSVPLLIAADAEWGMAMRLTDISAYPYAMTLGALSDGQLVYALGKRIGLRKRSIGVHVTFAPVLDVNSQSNNPIIGVRSFGDDPRNVAKQGIAFMEGLQAAGLWAVAKHFPGHGAAKQDSHLALPIISSSKEVLDSIDLLPFRYLIDNKLKGIMVGHLAVPSLTGNYTIPVSTSSTVLNDLLQKKMGFNGLIFTDALNMNGITGSTNNPALKAFMAGADVLLIPEDLTKSISNIKSHYISGKITPARLALSVKKILSAKYQLTLDQSKRDFYQVLPFNSVDRYLLQEIAEQSLVLVNHNENFPIKAKSNLYFVALGIQNDNTFLKALGKFTRVRELSAFEATTHISPNETLVVGIYADTTTPWKKQYLSTTSLQQLKKLLKYKNVHVVVFAKPYVLHQISNLGECSSLLLAHQQEPAFINAAAQMLFGKIKALGKLPVTTVGFD